MHRNGSLLNADGNITTAPLNGTPATFAFDARNRLTNVGNTSYTYNAENQRIGITENGVSTSYVINPNAALYQTLIKTTGGVSTYYVYGLGLIAEETGTDYKTYHYDFRGSTVALTDSTGLVTDNYSYAPYGELLSHTGTSDVDYLYNGRDGVVTDDNGLYQMRARYYSPELRRFLNEDEYAGKYDDILNINLYAYCEGNPVGFVDPSGCNAYSVDLGTAANIKELITNASLAITPYVQAVGPYVAPLAGSMFYYNATKDTVFEPGGPAVTDRRDMEYGNTATAPIVWRHKINGDTLTIYEGATAHVFKRSNQNKSGYYFAVRNFDKKFGYVDAIFPVDEVTAVAILKLGFKGYKEGVLSKTSLEAMSLAQIAGEGIAKPCDSDKEGILPHFHPYKTKGSVQAQTHSWYDPFNMVPRP